MHSTVELSISQARACTRVHGVQVIGRGLASALSGVAISDSIFNVEMAKMAKATDIPNDAPHYGSPRRELSRGICCL